MEKASIIIIILILFMLPVVQADDGEAGVKNASPEISSISVNRTIIDRKADWKSVNESVTITIEVKDNNGVSDINSFRLSIRDNNDSVVLDNTQITDNTEIDDTTLQFTYTYNPNNSIPMDNLGSFDIRLEATDNENTTVKNYTDPSCSSLFTVNDREVTMNLSDNPVPWDLTVTGSSSRASGSSPSLTEARINDSNDGITSASINNNDYEGQLDYRDQEVHQGDSGTIESQVYDGTIDGSSTTNYNFDFSKPIINSVTFSESEVDRQKDDSSTNSTDNVKITIEATDNAGWGKLDDSGVASITIRTSKGTIQIENQDLGTATKISDNSARWIKTYNPNDSLENKELGDFSVKTYIKNEANVENSIESSNAFTVTDIGTTISVSDIDVGQKVNVSGTAKMIYGSIDFDTITIIDSYEGTISSDNITQDGENWSATYKSTSTGGTSHSIQVIITQTGSVIDESKTTSYKVKTSGPLPPLNGGGSGDNDDNNDVTTDNAETIEEDDEETGVDGVGGIREEDLHQPVYPSPSSPSESEIPPEYWGGALALFSVGAVFLIPKSGWGNTSQNPFKGSGLGSWTFNLNLISLLSLISGGGMLFAIGVFAGLSKFVLIYLVLLGVGMIAYFTEIKDKYSPLAFIGIKPNTLHVLFGVSVGGAYYFATGLLSELLVLIPKTGSLDLGFTIASFGAFSMVMAGLVPLLEELSFRGVLTPTLSEELGVFPALILQGVAFGLIHMVFGAGWFLGLSAMIFAIIIGYYALRNQSLLIPLSAHITYNTIAIVIYLIVQGVI